MKLPGRAWLEFEVEPAEGGVVIRQTAMFDPVGLWGLAYWYALFPIHELVFRGMIRGIGRAAISCEAEGRSLKAGGKVGKVGKSTVVPP